MVPCSAAAAAPPGSAPAPKEVQKLLKRVLRRGDAEARAQILSLGSAALPAIREVLRAPSCDPPQPLVPLLEKLEGAETVLVDLLALVLPPSPYAECKRLDADTRRRFERAVLELVEGMGPRADIAFDTLAGALDSMPSLLPVLIAIDPTGERVGPVLATLACKKGEFEGLNTSLDALPSSTLDSFAEALRAGDCHHGVDVALLLSKRRRDAAALFESLLDSPDAATARLGLMLLAAQGRPDGELVGLAARTKHPEAVEWLRQYQAIDPRSVLALSDVRQIHYHRARTPQEQYQKEVQAAVDAHNGGRTLADRKALLRDMPEPWIEVPVTTPTVRVQLHNPSGLVDFSQIAIVSAQVLSHDGKVMGVLVSHEVKPCTLDGLVLEPGDTVSVEYEIPEAHRDLLTDEGKLALVVASARKRPRLFLEAQEPPRSRLRRATSAAGEGDGCRIAP